MRGGALRGPAEVLLVALRLGLSSFGGPAAHIGYFRDEYVRRRAWVDEHGFAELVAVTNLLPGPSSSQLGIAIGTVRAGKLGGVAAWLGFTLPSALVMTALGLGVAHADVADAGWLHGLELAAAAVVATAVVAMQRTLAPDLRRFAVAVAATGAALLVRGPAAQATIIVAAGILGALAFRSAGLATQLHLRFPVSRRLACISLALFAVLLVGLPVAREATSNGAVALASEMYRAGSLVFGGGHVVLPLLHDGVVDAGAVSDDDFLAGYGAAQALPGPLFTFSAYLGAVAGPEPNGVPGAVVALAFIFLPSFLLLAGSLSLWASIREHRSVQAAVVGIGAAVVGLVAAALWDPVLTSSIDGAEDVVVAVALVAALRLAPPWAVVIGAAGIGAVAF